VRAIDSPEVLDAEEKLHHALHTLWTESALKPDYDRYKWRDLAAAIDGLRTALLRHAA